MWIYAGFLNSSAASRASGAEDRPSIRLLAALRLGRRPRRSCLGLSFEAETSRIVFRKPVLPGFINEITLTGLRLPAGKVDVAVSRANHGFVVDVLDCPAEIEVLTIN